MKYSKKLFFNQHVFGFFNKLIVQINILFVKIIEPIWLVSYWVYIAGKGGNIKRKGEYFRKKINLGQKDLLFTLN